MIVVSDTSPVNYLVLIDRADVLRALFGWVLLPGAVFVELTRPETPAAVREWISRRPEWIEVRRVEAPRAYPGLGPGETEAIHLALSLRAEAVLLDEYLARTIAKAEGLSVTGVVGVLEQADLRGLDVDLPTDLARLVEAGYWIKKEILRDVLERYERRRRRSPFSETPGTDLGPEGS